MTGRFRLRPAIGWRRMFIRCLGVLTIFELTAAQTVALHNPDETDPLAAGVWRLGLASPGLIDDTSLLLDNPRLTALVLMKLDADGDGLTFQEVLGADLLSIAREVRQELQIGPPTKGTKDTRLGNDRALQTFLDDARGRVAEELDLGLPFEELPTVKLPEGQLPKGVGRKYLSSIPPPTLQASLEYLREFLNELAVETDFAGGNAALNLERRRVLTENAGHMLTALGAGATDVVAEQLLMMRTHVRGGTKGNQGDNTMVWIQGRRAARILDQIDVSLAMLGVSDQAKL